MMGSFEVRLTGLKDLVFSLPSTQFAVELRITETGENMVQALSHCCTAHSWHRGRLRVCGLCKNELAYTELDADMVGEWYEGMPAWLEAQASIDPSVDPLLTHLQGLELQETLEQVCQARTALHQAILAETPIEHLQATGTVRDDTFVRDDGTRDRILTWHGVGEFL